jgi:hypothetical protein
LSTKAKEAKVNHSKKNLAMIVAELLLSKLLLGKTMSKDDHRGVPWQVWIFVTILSAFVTAATPVFLERILNKQIQVSLPFWDAPASGKPTNQDVHSSTSTSISTSSSTSAAPVPSATSTPTTAYVPDLISQPISDFLRPGDTKTYEYKVSKGQTVTFDLKEGADSVRMEVFDPTGRPAYGLPEGTSLHITNTIEGNYKVAVSNPKESGAQFQIDFAAR